ncbi:hypothetical protein [uncultured Paraglaciecola sp.]|uniref:hypothetical protein n=1 Tax=uncultured Paraglaciecola sp. TaxID=1765024 RepID=UPI002624EA6F|nr:hypothetical protein [uncultured Paraglaciecola sp.]
MTIDPVLENDFYHDGRGPELQKVRWKSNGVVLVGFEYFNPDDEYTPDNLKHLTFDSVEAYSMSSDEVHGNILATGDSKAAIFEVKDSEWLASFNQAHLSECKHYQIMFHDEIYDVICKQIIVGTGQLNA